MKSAVKTFAVTAVVNYILVVFFNWDFKALATCEPIFRIIFFVVTVIMTGMAEAIFVDIANDKKNSFNQNRR
jgi:hypothetical protein